MSHSTNQAKSGLRKGLSLLLIMATAVWGVGQARISSDEPSAMVEHFWRQEVKGKRLTPQGWKELSSLLLVPEPFPRNMKFYVISNDSPVTENKEKRNAERARFYTGYWRYGSVDSEMRFRRSLDRGPDGARIAGWGNAFDTVLAPERDAKGNPTGKKTWKIVEDVKDPNAVSYIKEPRLVPVEIAAAMTYIRGVRDSTKNEAVKANASKTLFELEKITAYERTIDKKKGR